MTRGHLVAGLCFMALAAFLGWEATRLSYYSPLGPGAGFFPVWLCVALAALSLAVVLGALRSGAALPADFWPDRGGALRVVAVVAGLVFVVLALKPLGFRLTMALLGLELMLALGCRSVLQIAVVVLLGSVGSYALFVDALGLALPVGAFGF
ncbi:MAG: tripartite tricarboxylate transporter TctB family protein [Alphaproteobacteria bacterium]|nr:tripartite tricarboxylate transporter TctB family protein [Alphaproteobacteria bacterium]